jgi:NADPH:quinone reductase-like Zn-dependent oxidoreductase
MGVGALAEEISVPRAILPSLPDSLGFPEASALPVCAVAARLLVDAADVGRGDLLLVTGAAGMVGGFALQLAASPGARVLAAVRSSDAGEARRLGAEMTFDTQENLESAIRSEWQDGVDACIDTIGLGADGVGCVRDGGAVVTSVPTVVPDAVREITPETVQVQPDARAVAELADRAAAGELTVRIAEVLPLERFREGYDRLQRGGLRGKVVLTP